ncbi:hypothetical protein CEE99_13100, partial [Lactobacillus crispatus]
PNARLSARQLADNSASFASEAATERVRAGVRMMFDMVAPKAVEQFSVQQFLGATCRHARQIALGVMRCVASRSATAKRFQQRRGIKSRRIFQRRAHSDCVCDEVI